jgi:uncharacterized protein with HEPN domain
MSRTGVQLCDDILRSASSITQYANGIATKQQFIANPQACDAVRYRLAIIGEAAKGLLNKNKYSAEIAQASTPTYDLGTKLSQFKSSRNKIVHVHWSASPNLIANLIARELNPFVQAIVRLRPLV